MAFPSLVLQTYPSEASSRGTLLVDVAVLSADAALFETIKEAVGEQNPVWRARSTEETVELLMSGRCGVLLVDMGSVATEPTQLIEQIVAQFPDVVVVVAGRRDDESLLARLISDGLVYRFIHKPVTAKRAGMFLTAAMRHHVERRESSRRATVMPLARVFRHRFDAAKWLFVAFGVASFLGLLISLVGRPTHESAAVDAPAIEPPKPIIAPSVPADPVLARARAALDAGRLESPPGRNALDLFHAVLLAEPGQPEATAGLAATIKALLERADEHRQAGRLDDARRLVERVRLVDPTDPGLALFDAGLTPQTVPQVAQESAVLPDRDLELLSAPPPIYPAAALVEGIEGWVKVEFTVTEQGQVSGASVVDAEPRGVFDEVAVAAVNAWRYRPRLVDGKPVVQRTSTIVKFSLED